MPISKKPIISRGKVKKSQMRLLANTNKIYNSFIGDKANKLKIDLIDLEASYSRYKIHYATNRNAIDPS